MLQKFSVAIFMLAFLLSASYVSGAVERILPDTQKSTWPVSAAEEQGFNSKKLDLIRDFIESRTGTTGLVVAVNGSIIYTYGDIKQVSYIASCRKSVLSMLYGIYVQRGKIQLDKTLGELNIDDNTPLLPVEKTATVYDLITARSGIYLPAANAGGSGAEKNLPRGKTRPGTVFVYNNWDFNAAGTIFETQTGISIYQALQKELVEPLEMEDFQYSMHKKSGDSKKSQHLAYHMHFSTRDMARLGELMRLNGKWKGKQIVPAEWVKKSTTPVSVFYNMKKLKFAQKDLVMNKGSSLVAQTVKDLPAM